MTSTLRRPSDGQITKKLLYKKVSESWPNEETRNRLNKHAQTCGHKDMKATAHNPLGEESTLKLVDLSKTIIPKKDVESCSKSEVCAPLPMKELSFEGRFVQKTACHKSGALSRTCEMPASKGALKHSDRTNTPGFYDSDPHQMKSRNPIHAGALKMVAQKSSKRGVFAPSEMGSFMPNGAGKNHGECSMLHDRQLCKSASAPSNGLLLVPNREANSKAGQQWTLP